MFKKVIFLLLSLSGVIALSCSKQIEVDFPELGKLPVINCLFSSDQTFTIHISLNKIPADSLNYPINNALVSIKNGYGINLTAQNNGDGVYTIDNYIPQKGIFYTLEVEIPGFKKVSAISSIPATRSTLVKIKSFSGYKTEPVTGTGDEPKIPVQNIQVFIKDDEIVNDFYGLSIIQMEEILGSDTILENPDFYHPGYFSGSDDPLIISEGLQAFQPQVFMFKDIGFSSNSQKVELFVSKHFKTLYWLRFYQFSPEAFRYLKSWFIHNYTKSYDFWEVYEPHPLFSNIENGYGIFAGYSMQVYEVYPDSITTYQP